MERGINVKALIFKGKKEIILYADAIGTSDLDSPYISIDTEWVGRIFKHFPKKAWNNTIINMNTCASYRDWETDRKSTRLNSSHSAKSRMPSSA